MVSLNNAFSVCLDTLNSCQTVKLVSREDFNIINAEVDLALEQNLKEILDDFSRVLDKQTELLNRQSKGFNFILEDLQRVL